jgi:hypothetical protein
LYLEFTQSSLLHITDLEQEENASEASRNESLYIYTLIGIFLLLLHILESTKFDASNIFKPNSPLEKFVEGWGSYCYSGSFCWQNLWMTDVYILLERIKLMTKEISNFTI